MPSLTESIIRAVRVLASTQLGVAEERVTVAVAVRTNDKTGRDELAVDVRVDGEPLSGAQEVVVQEVLHAAVEAASIIAEARAEGVALSLPEKGSSW